jgi:hypothetical protein
VVVEDREYPDGLGCRQVSRPGGHPVGFGPHLYPALASGVLGPLARDCTCCSLTWFVTMKAWGHQPCATALQT